MKVTKVWELYKFPGGCVGSTNCKLIVNLWFMVNFLSTLECRAINTRTGEHIVK